MRYHLIPEVRTQQTMPTAEEEVQALLRFLAQEAKLPLSLAVRTTKSLQEAKLTKYAR